MCVCVCVCVEENWAVRFPKGKYCLFMKTVFLGLEIAGEPRSL